MRRVLVSLLALAIAVPGAVYALGLGRLQQNSGLNESFRGRIELLGADPEAVDDLKVELADNAQFDRAGIPRPLELNKLAFEVVVDPDGRSYVQITSRDPIREPYLNFLLELNWPQGRLVREYTALLDPPTYDPSARRAASKPVPAAPAPVAAAPVAAPAATGAAPAAAAPAIGGDGTLGRPTGASDTLWSIASASRPDATVSVQQMMLALLRANPEAFANDNINGLKRGYVLRIPDAGEAGTLSRADALEEVKRQHALWEELRGGVAASTPPEPVAAPPEPAPEAPAPEAAAPIDAPAPPAPVAAAPAPMGDAAVKIVAAGEGAGAAETLAPADLEKMSLDELREQLALAQESLTAQGAENTDLKSQVGESAELVDRLQRLVTLREQELAALQQSIAERGEQPVEAAAVPEAVPESGAPGVFEEPAAEAPAPAPGPAEPVPVAEPTPAPVAEEAPADSRPVGMLDGLVGSLVPKYVLDLVPGGAVTVLAVPLVALLVAIAVVVLRRGGGAERTPSSRAGARAAAAAATADDEDATVSAMVDSEDVTEAPTDLRGDEGAGESEAPTMFQAPSAAPASTEDPLQELNIYLAYEQFDKAEELVRNAIRNEPDNLGYKLRLLEVYYSASNKRDYEATARDVYAATGGTGPDWNTAVAMWQELSPDRPLFAAGGETEAALESTAAARQFVDITAGTGEEQVGADTVSFMPTGEATQPGPARAGAEPDSGGLDFDLGDTGAGEPGTLDVTGGAADAEDMFDISAGGPVMPEAAEEGGVLDITAAAGADTGEQILDLTQGGDEPAPLEFDLGAEADNDILDVTAGGATDVLDLTGGGPSTPGDDLLDVTVTGDLRSIDQTELLNVTSPGTFTLDVGEEEPADSGEPEPQAEVLDITGTATGDDGNLIDFDFTEADTVTAMPAEAGTRPATDGGDDLEFDISGLTVEAEEPPAANAADTSGGLEIDLSGDDFGLGTEGEDTLDLPEPPGGGGAALEGLSITMGDADDLSLDTSGLSLELDDGGDGSSGDGAETLRMDLPADLSLDIGGDEDQTLVLPRAPGAQEPSDLDDAEQALSLATSYMEMGGGFEADVRENLEKVLAIGTPQQREEAQRLLGQL